METILAIFIIAIVLVAGYGVYNVLSIDAYRDTLLEGDEAIRRKLSEDKTE